MALEVFYSFRLVVDYDFLEWLLKESPDKYRIISALLRINTSSKEHRKSHNLILKPELDKLLNDNIVKDKDLVKGGIKPFVFPTEIQSIIDERKLDEITQRILLGIILTDDSPYKVIILTTKEKLKQYQENSLFNKVKDLTIKTDVEAIRLVNSLFSKYCSEKELYRM